MRRLFVGIVWFLVFWIGSLFVGGMVLGAIEGAKAGDSQKGYIAGKAAGEKFGKKYGSMFLFGSAVIAIAGSAAGILPGTKKKS